MTDFYLLETVKKSVLGSSIIHHSPNIFPRYIPRTLCDILLKLDVDVLFMNTAILDVLTLAIFNVIIYPKNFHFHLSKCFYKIGKFV